MEDKVLVDRIRDECFQAVQTSKENYLKSLGVKLIDKTTGPKTYWSIINSPLNKYSTFLKAIWQIEINESFLMGLNLNEV